MSKAGSQRIPRVHLSDGYYKFGDLEFRLIEADNGVRLITIHGRTSNVQIVDFGKSLRDGVFVDGVDMTRQKNRHAVVTWEKNKSLNSKYDED